MIKIVNGFSYDTCNDDDREYLIHMGIIDISGNDIKQENIKVNKKETIETKDYCSFPMNTRYMDDKKMDYKILAIVTVFSNFRGITACEIADMDISKAENHRYIYEKDGTNSLLANKEEIEKLSQWKWRTIKRNINKLIECNNNVVIACKDNKDRVYYKINPYANNSSDSKINGTFVTIDSRILKYLINTSNSNGIKIYCVLKWLLWDNKACLHTEKQITYDFLAKQIGVSEKSGKNLEMISDILKTFNKVGLIKQTPYSYINKQGKRIDGYKYKINDYEEFNKILNCR